MATSTTIVRQLRLWSGLIAFAYVAMHLANHALGLISLEAMESGRYGFLVIWRSGIGTVLLYGAFSLHIGLALVSLYRRRHWRMPVWEFLQLLLGLLIPPFLISHAMGTRLAHQWFETTDSYTLVMLQYWRFNPEIGIFITIFLVLAWLHGCIGLHFWLRLVPGYARVRLWLFAFALLLPVFALLGFTQAGREVSRLAAQEGWVDQVRQQSNYPTPSQIATLNGLRDNVVMAYIAGIGMILVLRGIRGVFDRQQTVAVAYPNDQYARVPKGSTLLEASRLAGIPHASVCGGRGRCSTCRIRVQHGLEWLPPPRPQELRVLKRVRAPANVRLACQVRPTANLSVIPLMPAVTGMSDRLAPVDHMIGQEQQVAILFADLRGFTRIAEHKLPYDVVFLLNRYFEAIGGAIEQAGGIANQFTGDGVMALFGVDADPRTGCWQALKAAQAMVYALTQLSEELADDLDEPLRMGIGIHTGAVVIGRMGRGVARYLTAVGDSVHVASRFQELTKTYQCQLVISEAVGEQADIPVQTLPRHELAVRNRREPIAIRVVDHVQHLEHILAQRTTG